MTSPTEFAVFEDIIAESDCFLLLAFYIKLDDACIGNLGNSVTNIRSACTSEPSEGEWTCKFCGKPGIGLYDKIFGPNSEEYPAHFDCAREWRVKRGFEK